MKMISPKQLGPDSPESLVSGITDSAIIGNAAWIYLCDSESGSILSAIVSHPHLHTVRVINFELGGKRHPYFSVVYFLSHAVDKPGLKMSVSCVATFL